MAPPPVCQALFLSFQVSEPGSPGAGITYLRQASLPVAALTATIKSRTPQSPPEAPMTIRSFTASGAAEKKTSAWLSERLVSHTTFNLAALLVGRDHARRMVRHADDEIAPQPGAAVRKTDLLLSRVH